MTPGSLDLTIKNFFFGGEKPEKRGRGAEGKALVLIAAQMDSK